MINARDLSRIFRKEKRALIAFARSFGDVPAEDIVQDSFVRFFTADKRAVASPRGFLFRTARNLAIDSLRRTKAAPVQSVASIELARSAAHAPSPEDARIAADTAAALKEALAALPALQREALLLRRVERLPPGEVARRLGVSERQVQRLVLKAIAFCHARLTGDNDAANG